MSSDLRHGLGAIGEQLAAEHLVRRGYAILARNHRTRWGEIDIVACNAERILFCEVKTHRLGTSGPFDGLRQPQIRRLRKMASGWLQEPHDRPFVPEIRFDAIGVTIDAHGRLVSLEHLENAF